MDSLQQRSRRATWLLLASALWLSACTARGPRERFPQRRLPEPSGLCLHTSAIRDYRATSPTELKVRTGSEDWQYQIKLDRPCGSLQTADRIGWTSQKGLVCDYRHDAIIVGRERCAIGRIEEYKGDSSE